MRKSYWLLFSLFSLSSLNTQGYSYENLTDSNYIYGNNLEYSQESREATSVKTAQKNISLSDSNQPIDLNNFSLNAFPKPFPEIPPSPETLPDISSLSTIIPPNTSIQDIINNFASKDDTYVGSIQFLPPATAVGIWWRLYAQNTSVFNIPAVNEEMIIINTNSDVIWLQDVRTTSSIRSKSQRLLKLAYFNLMNHMFFVFYYDGQDPHNQKVREEQGFFVRIVSEQGFMEMSKNPKFPRDQSIYWRFQPQKPVNPEETDPKFEADSETEIQKRGA